MHRSIVVVSALLSLVGCKDSPEEEIECEEGTHAEDGECVEDSVDTGDTGLWKRPQRAWHQESVPTDWTMTKMVPLIAPTLIVRPTPNAMGRGLAVAAVVAAVAAVPVTQKTSYKWPRIFSRVVR